MIDALSFVVGVIVGCLLWRAAGPSALARLLGWRCRDLSCPDAASAGHERGEGGSDL